ncbi:2OG-Fe(II) oxygenase [bacterium]|nr:2OG-Fe(II) oxygenase [bacterium]
MLLAAVLAAASALDESCRDEHESCASWASSGECEKNKGFMELECAKSCATCDVQRMAVDARGQQNVPFAVPAGEVALTFQRALDEFRDLQPQLLANRTLPVLQLDAFASEFEVAALLRLGEDAGFESSEMQPGSTRQKQWRTSASAMCATPLRTSAESAVLAALFERAANLTRVPLANFEPSQVVRYHPGEYYNFHLDHFDELNSQPAGPRVYTLLIYLGDVDEGNGGETIFKYALQGAEAQKAAAAQGAPPPPMLRVTPRRGRALLWPNTDDADPSVRLYDAMHAGAPLRGGVKLAVNQWIRQRPF